MAWQSEMTIIVRHIIDDLDSTNYQYSDDRIEEAITVAAQLIRNEIEFSVDYSIEVENRNIIPDPTITIVGNDSKDNDFIALCCLRTAILFTSSQLKTYSLKAISIRDGASALDMRGIIPGLKILHEELTKKYEDVKLDYQTANIGLGKVVLSPYSPGADSATSSYTDYRSNHFI